MTVIDAFLDRPKAVPKHKIPFGNRKRKSFESRPYMPELEGCIVGGNLLPSTPSNNPFPMEANGGGNAAKPDADAQLFNKENDEESDGSSPTLRKQKILVRPSRTPVRNRRKSRWKLKFHHQALPPEYLRHYKQQERKRRQSETGKPSQANGANRKLVRKSEKKVFSASPKKKGERSNSAAIVKTEAESPAEKVEDGSEGNVLEEVPPSTPSSPSPPGPPRDLNLDEPERKRSPFTANANLSRSPENPFQSSLSGLGHLNIDVSQNKAFLENLLTNQIEINRVVQKERKISPNSKPPQVNRLKAAKHEDKQKTNAIPPTGKIMNYSDLPYMGEITLDGIKPRRGRKPKKADICHLIYKNYGQVFPGAPGKDSEPETPKKLFKWRPETTGNHHHNSSQRTKGLSENVTPSDRPDSPLPTVTGLINHSEVQNRIINSLLEKRLTQEMRLKTLPGRTEHGGTDEPLNLCIRDLKSLKIKLSRKHGNVYETRQKDPATTTTTAPAIFKTSQVKQEPNQEPRPELIRIDKTDSEPETSDEEDDLAPFNLVTTELRESSDEETLLNLGDQITLTRVKSPGRKRDVKTPESTTSESPSPMLFWPPPPSLFLPGLPPSTLPKYSNIPQVLTSSSQERKLTRTSSEGSRIQLKRVAPNSTSSKAAHVITKRKRSAIFIPPVPAESTTNPTTEVSICKFKFTGGAKPSLQEKKMLSVDSGGNFRYYSGTGDKSMRGYEYFPRESLQQCQENTGCSPSGVFLTASALGTGEKIPEEIGHSGFFDSDFPLQVSGTKTPDKKLKVKSKRPDGGKESADSSCYKTLREHLLSAKGENLESGTNLEDTDRDDGNSSDQSERDFDLRSIPQCYLDTFKVHDETSRSSGKSAENSSRHRRLRKTRKSIAREKLEQTFKEKGFLIQTQQLESAEGATYCKFRQLRKFTRYLFRSWKDYLPGNVRNLSVDAGVDNPEMIMHIPEVSVKTEVSDFEGTESFK